MARLVRLEATMPLKIDPATLPADKKLSICACGLSRTFPLCDGTHKTLAAEVPGKLYVYDRERKVVVEERADV
jgi:CDGSH-type Zn-finger protein